MPGITTLFRLYARYRGAQLAKQNPAETQQRQLQWLLRKAQDTDFGREHGFSGIKTVEEYQKQVPLRSYEDFWKGYWQKHFPRLNNCTWPGLVPYYPVSSGTSSGTTKFIPLTSDGIRSLNKAGTDMLVLHALNRPQSNVLDGKSFILGGSTELVEQAPGVFSGDLSGISIHTLPWWAKSHNYPDESIALMKNWEEKMERLAREVPRDKIRMLSGVPSWMLILIERLKNIHKVSRLVDIFPNLELLVHGGVNFAPYYRQFSELLQGSKAEMREVYPASEGFIAVADRGYDQGLRMALDNHIFYEFVPLEELQSPNPTRHWIQTIQPDVNYAIILSTAAGLWSYILGDTVKFVDTKIPRLLVTGRTSYFLSAFGEHLIGEEIEDAMSRAALASNAIVRDYSVGAIYPAKDGDLGGHLYVIEFDSAPSGDDALASFAQTIDQHLCTRNEDYDAHRAKGFGLNAPKIKAVPRGTFAAWMKSRGKLGGQHKVPRIINDQKLFKNLLDFVGGL